MPLVPVGCDWQFLGDPHAIILIRHILGAEARFERNPLVDKARGARLRKRLETGQREGRKPRA